MCLVLLAFCVRPRRLCRWCCAHSGVATDQPPAMPCCAVLGVSQDQMAMQSIADYFQHPIPEVPWNNEDEFISVLNKAGLTDLTV